MVLLKVSTWKGVIRFKKRGKLSPMYIGPFRILARLGRVVHRLDLPEEISQIHNTLHLSQFWKCSVDDSVEVLLYKIQVDDGLTCIERPVAVLDRRTETLQNQVWISCRCSGSTERVQCGSIRMRWGSITQSYLQQRTLRTKSNSSSGEL